MIRKIIHIDEEKCNGCGLCASACHEGAIDIIDGKARLVRENFCDGFGDCLPGCPTGAIRFEEREAPAYDEAAVKASRQKKAAEKLPGELRRAGGCPGSRTVALHREEVPAADAAQPATRGVSRLEQWPCQIKLLPTRAPFFDGAKLLVTLIGCPKLDAVDYSEKLTEIIRDNDVKSVTVVRMEVPCCGGLQRAAEKAIRSSGKFLPWQVVTISRDGRILD